MTTKTLLVLAVSALAVGAVLFIAPVSVEAFNGTVQSGVNAARGTDVPSTLLGDGGVLTTIVNTLLFIIGFLSVIMLIFGGLRYIISGGNAAAVTTAKNTILYAIVGLIIAIFAYAIVNFVIGSLTGGGAGGTNV
ncbi:hypothetical protein B7Z00_02965 [Candidatus Saccharibacteria bacterium 32-50-10]|nr:MAG: hypothetical protein B7Z00_02965 [Candidatus Saccharibacteria bacterium 32-50-10]